MSYKETDWFSCITPPVRDGVYMTRFHIGSREIRRGYSAFTNGRWGFTYRNINEAAQHTPPSSVQSREWKGVLRDDVPS